MKGLFEIDGEKRTKNVRFQIIMSFLTRGISIFLSFFVVRITIGYLGNNLYGVWVVLFSIITWLSLFDIGVGNGLRNKLTIALSRNDLVEARSYISTAYIILSALAVGLLLLFVCCILFIDWGIVFNSTLLTITDYRILMFIFFFSIAISFVLGLINSILNAFQQTALTNVISILTNLLFLSSLILFKEFFILSIVKMVFSYCMSLIMGHIILTVFFFWKHIYLIPSCIYFSKSKVQDILTLGGSFFVIQIAVLLIFTFDNFLILQLLGAEQVSVYNVVFKLFSIFTLGFGIVVSPLWSAFTEANMKNDLIWMRKTLKNLNSLFLLVLLGLVIMLFEYQRILDIWLPASNRVVPSFELVLALSIFVAISIWNNIYSFFLNGLGIVKMQMRTSILGAFLNIPLAIYFVQELHFGLQGVVYAMCASLIMFSFLAPIVTYKFFERGRID
jgi:O-antigen/teichoic acid export membrane protein